MKIIPRSMKFGGALLLAGLMGHCILCQGPKAASTNTAKESSARKDQKPEQEPKNEGSVDETSVTFKIRVNLVQVPVVRDSADMPIGGLRKEDFQLYDNNKGVQKESKPPILFWNPPNVDARLSASPGCMLSSVVEQASTRALKFVTNLQNFTAEERIEYRAMGNAFQQDYDVGTFDYTAAFGSINKGYVVQEYRKPAKGSHMFPAATQDVGLPEMALIFLPNFQKIYNMECEGSTEWNGQTVWVVHFRQRTNRQSHLVSLSFGGYPALLKGRAWIAQDSGEVVHMEIGLMREIPEVGVKEWFLSLDYAPVRFRTRDVQVWLPQSAEAYEDSRVRKTIIAHKFSTFQLFSVQTNAVSGSPKRAPQ